MSRRGIRHCYLFCFGVKAQPEPILQVIGCVCVRLLSGQFCSRGFSDRMSINMFLYLLTPVTEVTSGILNGPCEPVCFEVPAKCFVCGWDDLAQGTNSRKSALSCRSKFPDPPVEGVNVATVQREGCPYELRDSVVLHILSPPPADKRIMIPQQKPIGPIPIFL